MVQASGVCKCTCSRLVLIYLSGREFVVHILFNVVIYLSGRELLSAEHEQRPKAVAH